MGIVKLGFGHVLSYGKHCMGHWFQRARWALLCWELTLKGVTQTTKNKGVARNLAVRDEKYQISECTQIHRWKLVQETIRN